MNGGKFTSVIPVWLLKVRVESLCLEPAQQFHLVPRVSEVTQGEIMLGVKNRC